MTAADKPDDDTFVLYRDEVPRRAVDNQAIAFETTGGSSAVEEPEAEAAADSTKRSLAPLVILLLAACVLVGAVIAGISMRKPAPVAMPRTGDCVSLTQQGDGAEWRQATCEADEPVVFKVTSTGAGQVVCPNGPYVTYQRRGEGGGRPWACMVPQYRANQCYDTTPLVPTRVACTDAAADFKVTKVAEGTLDPSACGDATPLLYAGDKLLQCTARP